AVPYTTLFRSCTLGHGDGHGTPAPVTGVAPSTAPVTHPRPHRPSTAPLTDAAPSTAPASAAAQAYRRNTGLIDRPPIHGVGSPASSALRYTTHAWTTASTVRSMSSWLSALLTTNDGPMTPLLISWRMNSVRYCCDGCRFSSSVAKTRAHGLPLTTRWSLTPCASVTSCTPAASRSPSACMLPTTSSSA